MKTLVELITELDRVFDEKAKDGLEPVYLHVNGELIPLASISCEFDGVRARRVILKGELQ